MGSSNSDNAEAGWTGTCPKCDGVVVTRMMRHGPRVLCPCTTPADEYLWGRGCGRRTAGGVNAADEALPRAAKLRNGGH